jgi:hypothetical protein
MKIKLSPIASNTKTTIEVQGDTLIYNGVPYNMSAIPEGGEVEAEAPAVGKITRENGVINITIQYFYNSQECTYEERFPNVDGYDIEGVFNV